MELKAAAISLLKLVAPIVVGAVAALVAASEYAPYYHAFCRSAG